MENKTPEYAPWIPAAGGYVANGKVISKTPQYDENGKLKDLAIDPQNNVQTQGNPLNNITTENKAGSKVDVNSMQTAIGANGSFGNNTAKENGVLSTPAANSNIANTDSAKTPVDLALEKYNHGVATNNIKESIDALSEIQNITGEDYSAEIQNLTEQRNKKIQNIDNDYASRISQALQLGDYATAQALQQEQYGWQNSVGYQDAMQSIKEQETEKIIADYDFAYINSLNDIVNGALQAVGSYLNFQYDPMQDQSYLNAAGAIELQMRNNMAATGMYYSSTTQYAIAQAISQLIPVYEKMAKEEIANSISMLQNTANFLMNLEQTQFNMWKSQIQLKFQEAEEKRAKIEQAWKNAEYLGFVSNEDAITLNVPAGTLSKSARESMIEKQNKIDEEIRALDQKKILAEFQANLDLQKQAAIEELERETSKSNSYWSNYYKAYYDTSSAKSNTLSYTEAKTLANDLATLGYTPEQIYQNLINRGASSGDASAAAVNASATQVKEEQKKWEGIREDVKNKTFIVPGNTQEVYGPMPAGTESPNINIQSYDLGTAKDLSALFDKGENATEGDIKDFLKKLGGSKVGEVEKATALEQVFDNFYSEGLKTITNKMGSDSGTSKEAIKEALTYLDGFVSTLDTAEYGGKAKESAIVYAYENLLDDIYGKNNFDYTWWNFNDSNTVDESQKLAKDEIIKHIEDSGLSTIISEELKSYVAEYDQALEDRKEREKEEFNRAIGNLTNAAKTAAVKTISNPVITLSGALGR